MRDRPDILIASPIRPRQMEVLSTAYTLHRFDTAENPSEFLRTVGPKIRGVVTTGGVGLSRSQIDALPALEIVATSSVGTDKIDLVACASRGVIVTNTPDVLTDDVADLALGLVLATHRRMIEADDWVRSGAWVTKGSFPLTTSLKGRRLGILGLGKIGMAVASRAEVFGLNVGYHARSEKPLAYQYFSTPTELAKWSDILVLCLPGGPNTVSIVNREVIEALGSEGVLINVARGSVVDEQALADAISTGRIAGAGLDVFASEPSLAAEFARSPNVVLSPHHASGTETTRNRMAELVVDNLNLWFAENEVLTPVE